MKLNKYLIFVSIIFILLWSGISFSKYYDADGKPGQNKLNLEGKSFFKFWERSEKKFGSFSLTIGGGWQVPVDSLFDIWVGGPSMLAGLDFWLWKYISIGSRYNLIDYNGRSDSAVDTSGWDANIHAFSFLVKTYLLNKYLYAGGGYGLSWVSRTIPNLDSLDANLRSKVEGSKRNLAIAELGTIIWDFIQIAATYTYTFKEGGSINFSLCLFM